MTKGWQWYHSLFLSQFGTCVCVFLLFDLITSSAKAEDKVRRTPKTM